MRILTRYVLTELIEVFLVSVTGMTIFMLLIGLFREAYNQGLGLKQVILLIPYVCPTPFALPFRPRFCSPHAASSADWRRLTK